MRFTITMLQKIAEPEVKAPKLYRLSYFDCERSRYVLYPIGIHWIVMVARRVWEWSFYSKPSKLEKLVRQAEDKAYNSGFNDGYENGYSMRSQNGTANNHNSDSR